MNEHLTGFTDEVEGAEPLLSYLVETGRDDLVEDVHDLLGRLCTVKSALRASSRRVGCLTAEIDALRSQL